MLSACVHLHDTREYKAKSYPLYENLEQDTAVLRLTAQNVEATLFFSPDALNDTIKKLQEVKRKIAKGKKAKLTSRHT